MSSVDRSLRALENNFITVAPVPLLYSQQQHWSPSDDKHSVAPMSKIQVIFVTGLCALIIALLTWGHCSQLKCPFPSWPTSQTLLHPNANLGFYTPSGFTPKAPRNWYSGVGKKNHGWKLSKGFQNNNWEVHETQSHINAKRLQRSLSHLGSTGQIKNSVGLQEPSWLREKLTLGWRRWSM